MADINRRFSRAQWNNGIANSYQYQNPNQPYRGPNNNTNSSFNVNEYYNSNRSNNNVLNPNNIMSSESIHSVATNATNATTRRRFSMKLSQPPSSFGATNAPPLPFNAHSQILNSSFTHPTDVMSVHSYGDGDNDNSYNEINMNNSVPISPPKKHQDLLLNELSAKDFDADKFIQMKLGDSNAARIDDFSNFMDSLKDQNEEAVKVSLSESTSQVLAVSEAIKQTHEVLLNLKPQVNELTDALSQQVEEANDYFNDLNIDKNNANTNTRSKINRQSVLLLKNKWANSVNKVYSNIERIHDFLPPSPNRHLILESLRWGELNSITCKPVRLIQFSIFNDAVLVSTRLRSKNKSKGSSKEIKNIATYAWMVDTITIQRCSEIKELNDILKNNSSTTIIPLPTSKSNTTAPSSANDSDTIAHSTICIKTIDTNQIFLFQTDASTEFIKVFEAIKHAKNEIAFSKRRITRDSITKMKTLSGRPESSHQSLSQNQTKSNLEKQLSKEFDSCVATIDDLFTSVSLELGLHRYDESVGYLTRLREELENLSQIAMALGIPESALTSRLTSAKIESHRSTFAQHVHFVYNLKLSKLNKLTDKLIDSLKVEMTLTTPNLSTLKNLVDIFKVLNKENEAVEVYLHSKGRELEDCSGMVRIGGCGSYNDNLSMEVLNSSSNGLQATDRPMSRSSSFRKLNGLLSRPTSMGNTPEPEFNNGTTEIEEKTAKVMTGELITAYVCELSLVYMGFISTVWDEWNELFNSENQSSSIASDNKSTTSKISNIRVLEWINEYVVELKHRVEFALSDYDRNSEIFKTNANTMRSIFQDLKGKEMNIDYLLDL